MRRNPRPHDRDRYDGDLAHARTRQGAGRRRPGRLALIPELRAPVQTQLELEWSRAQIAA